MGVDFNKNKTWVGANIALHPRGQIAALEATQYRAASSGLPQAP